jgi:ELWxxDGT repeat protein
VVDLVPGPDSAWPSGLAALGDRVVFSVTGATGSEIWASDGTSGGTFRLAELLAAPVSTLFGPELEAWSGAVWFGAPDPLGGECLWRTDGTLDGTGCAIPLGAVQRPSQLTPAGASLYFVSGGLWVTDGTPAGTVPAPNPLGATSPSQLVTDGDTVYYRATVATGPELVASTASSQAQLTTGVAPWSLFASGGRVYFTSSGGAPMAWSAAFGPVLLATAGVSYPTWAAAGSRVYFQVGSWPTELWCTEGSPETTRPVGTARTLPSYTLLGLGASPDGERLVFPGWDAADSTNDPWITDGTAAGTHRIARLLAASADASPSWLVEHGGELWFGAFDEGAGMELRRSDGTDAGTVLAEDVVPGAASSSPLQLSSVAGKMLFSVLVDGRSELRAIDGAQPSAVLRRLTVRSPIAPVGGKGVFVASEWTGTQDAYALWATDGTAAGTVLIAPLAAVSSPSLGSDGERAFFVLPRSAQTELWITDGSPGGTRRASAFRSIAAAPALLAGSALFAADDGATGQELWRSDGTPAGTALVADLRPGAEGSVPHAIARVGDRAYFGANDGVGWALWRTDGTAAGTAIVRRIGTAPQGTSLVWIAEHAGALLLAAGDEAHGIELWRSDGTEAGTALVKDVWPGTKGGLAGGSALAVPDAGIVLFTASDPDGGMELWVTDGTEAGTRRARDVAPGAASSSPWSLTRAAGKVFFSADDGVHGRELWAWTPDRTAPTITCPADRSAEATGPDGADVDYPPATASDDVSAAADVGVSYSAPPGAAFPLGSTEVVATATDEAGNAATCTFRVTISDTTAPELTCPGNVRATATSDAGVAVVLPAPSVSDAVTLASEVTLDPASGSVFPVGTTEVVATARDEAGNTASCAFEIVVDPPAPGATGGCGCGTGAVADVPGFLVALALAAGRRGARRSAGGAGGPQARPPSAA